MSFVTRWIEPGVGAALAVALPAALAAEPIDETKPASPTGTVRIENVSGSVVVKGWSRDEIAVSGELGEGSEELQFRVTGDRATIKVVLPRRARNVEETDLIVQVPAASALDISTVSATIDVSGVTGDTEAESVSGDVKVEGDIAHLEATSVSGNLEIAATTATLDAETVSGTIEILGDAGEVEGSSVSGDIRVEGKRADSVSLETVSGTLEFEGHIGKGPFDFESHSGSIELALGGEPDAEFEISTQTGSIRSDFGEAPRPKRRYGPGEELDFTLGSGTAHVSISTISGSIRLVEMRGEH